MTLRLTENELATLFRRDTNRAADDRGQCLDAGTIAALTAGELEEPRRSDALEHLGSCSQCSEEARLIAPLEEWAARVTGAPSLAAGDAQIHRPVFSRPAAFALAASLLVPLAGVAAWQWLEIRSLHETLDRGPLVLSRRLPAAEPSAPDLAPRVAELEAELGRLSQPQLNPLIVDLEPDALRSAASAKTIDVPRGAPFFNVILSTGTDTSHPAFGLEIRSAAGEVIWRGTGLQRSEYGTFTAALPTRLVPPGTYQLRLFGIRGSREDLLQRYDVRVRSN